ncbi:39S ribosomal protein L44, mitochondrial [Diplodia seriata]
MITRFLTEVNTKFNPFVRNAKTARNFLALLPPNARADGMKINAKMLPRLSKEPTTLELKFSKSQIRPGAGKEKGYGCIGRLQEMCRGQPSQITSKTRILTPCFFAEDGKEMKLDLEKLKIREVEEEVNRHSRLLARQEELSG